MRHTAIWIGVDPTQNSVVTIGDRLTFKKGVPEVVDCDTANLLSKVQGFIVFRTPTTFFEVIRETILPVKE